MLTEPEILSHPYVVGLEQKVARCTQTIEEQGKANESYRVALAKLEHELAWFKKQLFGPKSERRTSDVFPSTASQPSGDKKEGAPERKKSNKQELPGNASESGLRFGSEVPVEEVPVKNPLVEGLSPSEYEVIDEKVVDRLCRRKGSHYVKRYRQPVVKILATGEITQPPAPERVIASSQVDVSFLVGMLTDKFLYHLPLYRQHQQLRAEGIEVSRASLSTWAHAAIDLLVPIYSAHKASVLSSSVLSMDESPHKAGRRNGGNKMSNCYFWFLYGDQGEVLIHQAQTRGLSVVKALLLDKFSGVILSDGYPVYEQIVKELNLLLANCWAHARRGFVEAEKQEPVSSAQAVAIIRELYQKEEHAPPEREARLEYRLTHMKPIVDRFFDWLTKEQERLEGFPKTSYSKAVTYASKREASLRLFLSNPEVPIDNNHTERTVRPLVLGRKNYLFCWTEIGAEKVAIIQSLLISCQIQGVAPWEYLNDVLLRVSTHPASKVAELTPRNWKMLFSAEARANAQALSKVA